MDTYKPAFAKPSYKKPHKPKYAPLFPLGYCWGCHTVQGLQIHHLYSGNPDRQHSDRYGLYVHLCQKCHQSVTDELDRELIDGLKMEGQRRFERVHGHKEWMEIFQRNYL